MSLIEQHLTIYKPQPGATLDRARSADGPLAGFEPLSAETTVEAEELSRLSTLCEAVRAFCLEQQVDFDALPQPLPVWLHVERKTFAVVTEAVIVVEESATTIEPRRTEPVAGEAYVASLPPPGSPIFHCAHAPSFPPEYIQAVIFPQPMTLELDGYSEPVTSRHMFCCGHCFAVLSLGLLGLEAVVSNFFLRPESDELEPARGN